MPTDPLVDFGDVLRAHGFDVDAVKADGALHRERVDGDRAGKKSGWYVLHGDNVAAGAFGNWRTAESSTWRSKSGDFTPAERRQLATAWAEAKRTRDAERDRERHNAKLRAENIWRSAATVSVEHPYLVEKGVPALGIRQLGDLLVVPMRDTDTLWNVQTIGPDGTKRFLRGGRKRGLYHAIGGSVAAVLALAEGYSTGATVHIATGYPVAIAFDAANLEPTARELRKKFPLARLLICGDDDAETEQRIGRNPGKFYAERAAKAVGGTVVLPEFAH